MNQKLNVGVDIEEISRFIPKLKDKEFLNKIFTKQEISYCMKKSLPQQHFAARFAAKESIIKALSKKISYKNIEIIMKDSKPLVKLNKKLNSEIKISLSHTKDKAIAFCIILK